MLTNQEVNRVKGIVLDCLGKAGIILQTHEIQQMEITDFGLGQIESTGLQVVVYENNERYCAKELILLPKQTCPEHYHPPINGSPGKQETFRCRWGEVYLYIPGVPASRPKATPPATRLDFYRVWHEVILKPGNQFTILPGTLHWFQSGPEGAVVSEFSSTSRDETDVFTDPSIRRTD